LNNIIEQDHRFIKKRITASLGFRSAEGRVSNDRGLQGDACHPKRPSLLGR
jgi:transposase-like protein